MPTFDIVCVGTGGGPDETNLSAYVFSIGQSSDPHLTYFDTLKISPQTVRCNLGRWTSRIGGRCVAVEFNLRHDRNPIVYRVRPRCFTPNLESEA
jgi:hypothetical protein